MNNAPTFILIFVAILVAMGVAAWLIRRFATNRLGANTNRGRMPRLAVIDAAAVDGRRRLVLVRRDNVEHLLMIGGPTDIVVEPNIVRATPGREALPQRPPGTELPPRIAPLPDAAGWSDADAGRPDHVEPQMPEPPPRPARPSFAEEARRPPPIAAERERRSDPLAGFAAEPLGRPERPEREPRPEPRLEPRTEPRAEPRAEPRPEPMPPRMPRGEPLMPRANRPAEPPKAPALRAERSAPPPPPAAAPPPSADQNLAEMAQRLEAALRRPAGSTDAPPVAPEPPAGRSPRAEPASPPAAPKTSFENLEDEMASLLGRPKSPSS
jgi:flagellar protein FliO/FliZ